MATPICGSDCNTLLPPVNFDFCAPKVHLAKIRRIFVAAANAAAFSDWTNAAEWTSRISENSMSIDAIRPMVVVAEKPAGTPVTANISLNRVITLRKDQVLNYVIDDISPETYEFMRSVFECGQQVKFWYETDGGYMYGGNTGITTTSTTGDLVNGNADESYEQITGGLSWKDKFSPERALSPIFDVDFSEATT